MTSPFLTRASGYRLRAPGRTKTRSSSGSDNLVVRVLLFDESRDGANQGLECTNKLAGSFLQVIRGGQYAETLGEINQIAHFVGGAEGEHQKTKIVPRS
jgi:hypothetical protein